MSVDAGLWEKAYEYVKQLPVEKLRDYLRDAVNADYALTLTDYLSRKRPELADLLASQMISSLRRTPIYLFRSGDPSHTAFFDARTEAIYVNATFLKYLGLIIEEELKRGEVLKTYDLEIELDVYLTVTHLVVLQHELMHKTLGHYWSSKLNVEDAYDKYPHLPKLALYALANLLMDYVINAGFLANVFPDVYEVLKKRNLLVHSGEQIAKAVADLFELDNEDEVKEYLQNEDAVLTATWSDSFWHLVDVIKHVKKPKKDWMQAVASCNVSDFSDEELEDDAVVGKDKDAYGGNENEPIQDVKNDKKDAKSQSTNQDVSQAVSQAVSQNVSQDVSQDVSKQGASKDKGRLNQVGQGTESQGTGSQGMGQSGDSGGDDQRKNENVNRAEKEGVGRSGVENEKDDEKASDKDASGEKESGEKEATGKSKRKIWTVSGVKEVESDVWVCSKDDEGLEEVVSEKEWKKKERELLKERAARPPILDEITAKFLETIKKAGVGKGCVVREFEASLPVKKEQLRNALSRHFKRAIEEGYRKPVYSSWTKINRRFPEVLPGLVKKDEGGHLQVFVDVSGSISEDDLKVTLSVLKTTLAHCKFVRDAKLYFFDDGLQGDVVFLKTARDLDDVKVKGGGGTKLEPALDEVLAKQTEKSLREKRKYEVAFDDLVCVFTDGALFDDTSTLAAKLKRFKELTRKPIVVFCVGSGNALPPQIVNLAKVMKNDLKLYAVNVAKGVVEVKQDRSIERSVASSRRTVSGPGTSGPGRA